MKYWLMSATVAEIVKEVQHMEQGYWQKAKTKTHEKNVSGLKTDRLKKKRQLKKSLLAVCTTSA